MKKDKLEKSEKNNIFKKFIEIIKKKALRQTSLTIILVLALIFCFIAINLIVQNLKLAQIDVTTEKLYSISDESKKQIQDISDEITIYLFGYTQDSSLYSLAKQYESANNKIKVEAVTITDRPDLATKYGIDSEDGTATGIIIQSSQRYKVLAESDLYTYDTSTYETIDITEQKLTNGIIETTINKKPKVYFLTGHGEYSISSYMYNIKTYLENEVNEVAEVDLLTQSIPEDCDCLVVPSPTKDVTEYEANLIINYINNGGNILWLSDANYNGTDFTNLQKVLDLYGVSVGKGIIMEQDSSKMILNNPEFIKTNVSYHEVTKDIYTALGVMFIDSGRLNIVDTDKQEELNVTATPFISSSDKSFYREDLSNYSDYATSKDEEGSQVVGAEFSKKVNDEKESKLIIYANATFATNAQTTSGNSTITFVELYNNKDLVLNSVSYLTGKEDAITIRKSTGTVTYTATEAEDTIIRIIIFTIPVVIILIGIIIWQIRRRKK